MLRCSAGKGAHSYVSHMGAKDLGMCLIVFVLPVIDDCVLVEGCIPNETTLLAASKRKFTSGGRTSRFSRGVRPIQQDRHFLATIKAHAAVRLAERAQRDHREASIRQ